MIQIKTVDSFNDVIKIVSTKVPSYSLEVKGIRKILHANGKKLAAFRPGIPNPDLQSKKARKLMASVRSSVTRYIKKVNFEVPVIRKEYPVVFTNRLFWESIPANTEFYIIDARHCYWRIAFLQNYIGKNLYEKYAEDQEMKTVKNISLAVLNSIHKYEYYYKDQKIHEVESDLTLYNRVYNNIRYSSYNLCGRIRNDLDDACFAYRTDGVFILKPGLHRAKKIFEANNLLYKIEKFIKIDNKSYCNSDGEIKKFM
jgi:hypothetical protein